MEKPINRSLLRQKIGWAYYSALRRLYWLKEKRRFARQTDLQLQHQCFYHKTPLLRKLKDVDMQLQYNKIINLKLAAARLNSITVYPNQIFSYWYAIGKPTAKKGYVDGMILQNGKFLSGIGGGLCQMSNLIFWLTLHTGLSVIERHRHGYDVFPDANRTQPFGSGATCFYPHGDLMIKNNTNSIYYLKIWLDDEYLHGSWFCSEMPIYTYEIVERNHEMKSEFWGGYSRNNEIYKQTFDANKNLVCEELAVKNSAIMMYSPFLQKTNKKSNTSI